MIKMIKCDKVIKMIKMNNLKTKLGTIVVVCLLMTNVQAQSLQGKWSVEKVTIEKNTDGNVQTIVYDSATEVKNSYVPCPQEWEVTGQNLVLRYPDGRVEPTRFTLAGNQLTMNAVGAIHTYQYSLSGGKLVLSITYNYRNNLPTGQVAQIEEKWTINLVNNL